MADQSFDKNNLGKTPQEAHIHGYGDGRYEGTDYSDLYPEGELRTAYIEGWEEGVSDTTDTVFSTSPDGGLGIQSLPKGETIEEEL